MPVLIWFPAQQLNSGMKIKPKTQISPVVTNKKFPLPLLSQKKKPSDFFQTQLVNVFNFSEGRLWITVSFQG